MADDAGGEGGKGRRGRRGAATASLLGLPIGWLILFFLLPVLLVVAYSVGEIKILPAYDHGPGLDSWRTFFFYTDYMSLFWKSVRTSLTVSISCVVLAFPVAYFLAQVAGSKKYTLLLLTIAPFLTSYLLRVLAMRVLLNNGGLIQSALRSAGILGDGDNISWMFNSLFAVHLVLVYVWVPFVALPIFVSLEALAAQLARGVERSGRKPVDDLLAHHVPDVDPRGDRRVHLRVHPDDRRIHHAAARRGAQGLPVR